MLDSLFVRNFRLFKKLEIEQLSRVNLIVGKNNSGKSCFLEAIKIYIGNALPNVLFEIINQRNEFWEFGLQEEGQDIRDYENPLRHLFFGYKFPDVNTEGIRIGTLGEFPKPVLHICTRFYEIISLENGQLKLEIKKFRGLPSPNFIETGMALEVLYNGALINRLPLIKPSKMSLLTIGSSLLPTQNIKFIPARGTSDFKISLLWDNINLTDLEDEVIKSLRLINKDIKAIALINNKRDGSNQRVAIARLENSSERIPLESMGDGIAHIFDLILALTNAKDGTLLIDEFENGLHWSILPKVWNTIFRLADRLNVQVFATTHSRDCIQGFKQAWEQNESLGSFHRLDPDPENGAKSIFYSLETLSDALDMDVEVR